MEDILLLHAYNPDLKLKTSKYRKLTKSEERRTLVQTVIGNMNNFPLFFTFQTTLIRFSINSHSGKKGKQNAQRLNDKLRRKDENLSIPAYNPDLQLREYNETAKSS